MFTYKFISPYNKILSNPRFYLDFKKMFNTKVDLAIIFNLYMC